MAFRYCFGDGFLAALEDELTPVVKVNVVGVVRYELLDVTCPDGLHEAIVSFLAKHVRRCASVYGGPLIVCVLKGRDFRHSAIGEW